MQTWITLFTLIFWIVLLNLIFTSYNFIILIFLSELMWIILYTLCLLISNINDNIHLLGMSFLLLGLAALEFVIGFLLIITFKQLGLSLNLIKNLSTNISIFNSYNNFSIFNDRLFFF